MAASVSIRSRLVGRGVGRATLFVAVAASLLVCISNVASAKYAGHQYLNDTSDPGYLSWEGAINLATRQGGDNGATPHGGYAVNTTKCAVCHSAHRAATDATAAGIGSDWKLTPGAMSCVACHTPSGSNPVSSALIEWAAVYSDGGPHRSFNCLSACHGSVHGGSLSEYGALVAWNLTNRNDAAIAAAFAAGNVSDATGSGAGGSNWPYGALYGAIDEDSFRNYTGAHSTQAEDMQYRTMRAMATGYTCGGSGCHTSSQFAVNKVGYAESRASDPSAPTTLDILRTGHITNMPQGCPPCHSCYLPPYDEESTCALCHDMLGMATASTAFPHGNRSIWVAEFGSAGYFDTPVPKLLDAGGGNLWMYAGDSTMRNALGEPAAPVDGGVVDGTLTVIEDAVGGDGNVGNINDGTCLKCHGYEYWPSHGMQFSFGRFGKPYLNFSTK